MCQHSGPHEGVKSPLEHILSESGDTRALIVDNTGVVRIYVHGVMVMRIRKEGKPCLSRHLGDPVQQRVCSTC